MTTVVVSDMWTELWADPKTVAAQCPDCFTYHEITVWNEITEYHQDDLVRASDAAVYRAVKETVPAGVDPVVDAVGPDPSWAADPIAQAQQEALEGAISQASWVIWSLTNGAFHGTQCWIEDYKVNGCKLRLQRGPVESITSVQRIHQCGTVVEDFPNWCLESVNTLSFCCQPCLNGGYLGGEWFMPRSWACGCDDNVVRVTYQIGANLPPGTSALVGWLACEYCKALAGKACSLPERVTTITRQGVSWTLLDPQDFLERGFSGISRLDQWLAVARRGISGRFIDPMRGIRLFSHQGDCGGQFGDRNVTDPVPDPFETAFRTQSAG